uniref:Putative ovule protein n=1 Tax=Solanum chacoense TaxID=4108 RepID=A0A0V0GX03_SOLCH
MRVLALSYHHLPHHLRACFLYFALFPEDSLIFVNTLLELWVAEGFLKVEDGKYRRSGREMFNRSCR